MQPCTSASLHLCMDACIFYESLRLCIDASMHTFIYACTAAVSGAKLWEEGVLSNMLCRMHSCFMHFCIHASMHPCAHAIMLLRMHRCVYPSMQRSVSHASCNFASMHLCIRCFCTHAYFYACMHLCIDVSMFLSAVFHPCI